MAQATNENTGAPPPLSPDWLLQPLAARSESSSDLDLTDSRFTAMLDLVTRGDYVTAGRRAEQALHDGLMDVRVLGYYLYGCFVEKGLAGLPLLYRILAQTLGPNMAALGPREKREIHVENTLQWMFAAMLRNVEHHERSQDATWKQWMDNATRPAIDEALDLTATLEPLIAQHSAKSRAALRFQSLDAWVRGLERPQPAAPPSPKKVDTQPAGSDATGDKGKSGKKSSKKEVARAARQRAEDAKRYGLSFDFGDGKVVASRPASIVADSDDDSDDNDDDDGDDGAQADASLGRRDEGDEDDERENDLDSHEHDEDRIGARAQRAAEEDPDFDWDDDRSTTPAHDDEGPSSSALARRPVALDPDDDDDDDDGSAAEVRPARGVNPPHTSDVAQSPRAGREARSNTDLRATRSQDADAVEGSQEWQSLLLRLRSFESLLASGDYMKAAVLAHDIQQAIATFDPVRYFPSVFSGFLAAFSTHMHPLEACLKESGSVQFKVLQKLFQVAPDEFMRRR